MSDYFGDGPGGNPRRRRQFGRGYRDSGDALDGWGMADNEDYYDGEAGDIEDYAGGMVDEERYAGLHNTNYDEEEDSYYPSTGSRYNRREVPFDRRSRHQAPPGADDIDSTSLQRAYHNLNRPNNPRIIDNQSANRERYLPEDRRRMPQSRTTQQQRATPVERRERRPSPQRPNRRPSRRNQFEGINLEDPNTQLMVLAAIGFGMILFTCLVILMLLVISG